MSNFLDVLSLTPVMQEQIAKIRWFHDPDRVKYKVVCVAHLHDEKRQMLLGWFSIESAKQMRDRLTELIDALEKETSERTLPA